MAITETVTCDLCSMHIDKADRTRHAVRRNQDRPESAEYVDVGPCCHDRPIGDLIKVAEANRPEDASGYKA